MFTPLVRKLTANSPAYTILAEGTTVIGKAPFAGTVTAVRFISVAAITGANTDTRKHNVINKGAAGSGTTSIAALQYNSGVNAVAFDEKTVTLSATAADKVVAADDVIAVFSDAIGNGLADPGGHWEVEITRTAGD